MSNFLKRGDVRFNLNVGDTVVVRYDGPLWRAHPTADIFFVIEVFVIDSGSYPRIAVLHEIPTLFRTAKEAREFLQSWREERPQDVGTIFPIARNPRAENYSCLSKDGVRDDGTWEEQAP